jgi:hypothetical protein
MPASERSHELIQRYLDGLASTAELVELECLLSTEPAVADAFAEAAKLHACLNAHFQKQYEIDRIARLLEESAASATVSGAGSEVQTSDAELPTFATTPTIPAGSIFVPPRGLPLEARHLRTSEPILRLPEITGRVKWIAAAVLLLAIGGAIWYSTSRGGADQPYVTSGSVVVAGHEITTIPEAALFEVSSREPAIIDLPGGARIELVNATQAIIRRDVSLTVLQLVSGGGKFNIPSGQNALQIETPLGKISATGGRFSAILATISSVQISMTEPIEVPQLTIAVAGGSVTVERSGVTTTLSAGDERVFF